jgi:archaellum biogenesis ATPase FlaH
MPRPETSSAGDSAGFALDAYAVFDPAVVGRRWRGKGRRDAGGAYSLVRQQPEGGMSYFTLDDVLAVTDLHKQLGDGSYMVRCPAHDDRTPSLHVTPDGKYALLHCFTCEYKDVAEALESAGAKNGATAIKVTLSKIDVQGLADYCRVDPAFLKSLHPDLIFRKDQVGFAFPPLDVVKWRPGEGGQDFGWKPDGDRPPLWPVPPQPLPYTIYLTAGETDCICLRAAGLPAFALTKGEGGIPSVAVFEALKAHGVSTIRYAADVDTEGRKAIPKLLAVIEEAGILSDVLDLTPYLNPLLGEKDVRSLNRRVGVSKTSELVEAAAKVTPDVWAKSVKDIIAANQEPISWVVEPVVPRGEVTLMAGKPKAGKTTFVYRMVEQMREGGKILHFRVNKGKVLVWSERSDRINAQRFKDLFKGVDQPHVHVLSRFDPRLRGKTFEAGVRMVLAEARRLDCDLVILDTFAALARVKEENQTTEVQAHLDMIAKEAEASTIAVVVIHHIGKSGMIRGTTTFEAEPSTILKMEGEKQPPRTLTVESNIVTLAPDPIKFKLDEQGEYQVIEEWESDEAQDLLDALPSKLSEAKMVGQVMEELGQDKGDSAARMSTKRALDTLVKAGKVSWTEVTDSKGRKRKGYCLVPEAVLTNSGSSDV